MRRIICWAVFALLFSSGAVFAQAHQGHGPHARFIWFHRYHPPYIFPTVVPDLTVPPVPYSVAVYPMPNYVTLYPAYVFVGSNAPTRPQLVFKDGKSYAVSDYWRVDNELHFVTVEEGGTKSVPRTVAFDNLDVQRTKDAAAAQGFRFVVRDEPIEQWLQHRGTRAPRHKGTAK